MAESCPFRRANVTIPEMYNKVAAAFFVESALIVRMTLLRKVA